MNRPRLTLGLAALGAAVLLTTASDARAQSADPNDPWTRLPGGCFRPKRGWNTSFWNSSTPLVSRIGIPELA